MSPRNENRNEGTFVCSPGTRIGTRVRSPKPPFYETAFKVLSPGEQSRFAVRNDSNRHWLAMISNCTIRIVRPKTVRIAVKALRCFTFKIGFKSRDSIHSARAKRDFANLTLFWVKNCQNIKIKLARCLILSVAGFDQTLWRPSCRETARVSTARVVRGVSPGVPQSWQWGATRGQSFLLRKTGKASDCAKHRGAKRDFALCPVGAPQGDVLVRSGWENSVNMPSVLANTSTNPSQEYTLFFRKRKIRDFAGPVGDTPKVTLRKSCLAPTDSLAI